jgi:DNA polymerase-3 subunit delta
MATTSAELYKQLRSNTVKQVYIFAGEETYMQEEAWRFLEKKMGVDALNVEVFYAPETQVQNIIIAAQTMPFLSEKRLIVVKDTQKLKAADTENLAEFFKHPPETSCVVLLWADRMKKDSKNKGLFSVVEKSGSVVEFRALYERELPSWIVQRVKEFGKSITPDAVQAIIEESGSGLLDLSNELEKLDLYTGEKTEITLQDVEKVSGHTKLADLNRLADAVEEGKASKSLEIAENLLREGEIPLKIIATIYRVMKRLLLAKSMLDHKKSSHQEIRQELQLNPYFHSNYFTKLARFPLRKLERSIEHVLQADVAIKTSARPEQMIIEELILLLSCN